VLLTARLAMRPWVSGRLLSRRPILGVCFAAAFIVFSQLAFFWNRATEIADVGEPFDVKAYIATLPSPEENESGTLIRKAFADLKEHRKKVADQMGRPNDPKGLAVDAKSVDQAYNAILHDILQNGWMENMENKDFDRWLDEIFKGEWAGEVQRATQLPLGVVQDPRIVNLSTALSPIGNSWEIAPLFIARSLQLQARGDLRSSLHQLEMLLAIARLAKNNADSILFTIGEVTERFALSSYCKWLEKVSLNKELMRAGLDILQRHEAANPSIENNIKAEYLMTMKSLTDSPDGPNDSSSPPTLTENLHKLRNAVSRLPWEDERQDRIFHAAVAADLGFRVKIHGDVERRKWETTLVGPRLSNAYTVQSICGERWWQSQSAKDLRLLHAVEIVTALALYYADHHKAPAQLDELVPAYVASLSFDPVTNRAFGYRISKGEKIDLPNNAPPLQLAPGQAVLFAGERAWAFYLPVPTWVK
jgi:hypothetical protein